MDFTTEFVTLKNNVFNRNISSTAKVVNGTLRRPHLDIFDPHGNIRVPLYSLIFLLSLVGNILVISTLIKNRRMRTVTNVFLLNLSVSDLLLAVFCMPFTLIPQLMRNFVFGEIMCKSIRYAQAVSVSVSCFTLLTISLERYFAIVEPLRSRRWQTRSHSYKCIIAIWITGIVIAIPIMLAQQLLPLQTGGHACREIWTEELRNVEIAYSIILVCFLFILPLLIMGVAYGCIGYRLWVDIRRQMQDHHDDDSSGAHRQISNSDTDVSVVKSTSTVRNGGHISLRHSNLRNSVANRKRVIKMLFVVVLEHFICWTPLYVVSTWMIVDYFSLAGKISQTAWSMLLLLAYSSSFIHPITYCFMNKNFRKGFMSVFRCMERRKLSGTCTEMSNLNSTSSPGRLMNKDYTYSKVAQD